MTASVRCYIYVCSVCFVIIMRPSSLGGGRILRRTLSVRLSVCLSVRPVIVTERHVAPPSELQWHTCTFRHALRAAYRTAISAAQFLVLFQETQNKHHKRKMNCERLVIIFFLTTVLCYEVESTVQIKSILLNNSLHTKLNTVRQNFETFSVRWTDVG